MSFIDWVSFSWRGGLARWFDHGQYWKGTEADEKREGGFNRDKLWGMGGNDTLFGGIMMTFSVGAMAMIN